MTFLAVGDDFFEMFGETNVFFCCEFVIFQFISKKNQIFFKITLSFFSPETILQFLFSIAIHKRIFFCLLYYAHEKKISYESNFYHHANMQIFMPQTYYVAKMFNPINTAIQQTFMFSFSLIQMSYMK